jgi:hypothetical protein
MKAQAAPMAVGDYCSAMNASSIIVNQDYQRNPGIWKPRARSFFVESILLHYPIPKLFLFSKIDLVTRKTVKEIVDGQQRSLALRDFYNNKYRLSVHVETEELKGLNYDALPDEWKERFLSYSLPIDQFIGVDESEVREAFRRMNLNNVPLNDEEQRNAIFDGDFKWFIHEIATRWRKVLFDLGVFTRRDSLRMQDYKFYTDVIFAWEYGIQTTKSAQLHQIYRKYDASFPLADHYRHLLDECLGFGASQTQFKGAKILRPVSFYAMVLAYALKLNPQVPYREQVERRLRAIDDEKVGDLTLSRLAAALEAPEEHEELYEFVRSVETKTNVADHRTTRVAYLYKALLRDA